MGFFNTQGNRAYNSDMINPTCPKYKLIPEFVAVQLTCKFDADFIKNEVTNIQIQIRDFQHSRASNSDMNDSILPNLIRRTCLHNADLTHKQI